MSEPPMLRIGPFSRASSLSIKALRFYHETGLLVPAVVDPETGYRSYSPAQLIDAAVIHRLRELDVPLDSIREVLTARDPVVTQKVLAEQAAVLEARVDTLRRAVDDLYAAVDAPALHTGVFRRRDPARTVLAFAGSPPEADLATFMITAATRLLDALTESGAVVDGPFGASFPPVEDDVQSVEAFVPVASAPLLSPATRAMRRAGRRAAGDRCRGARCIAARTTRSWTPISSSARGSPRKQTRATSRSASTTSCRCSTRPTSTSCAQKCAGRCTRERFPPHDDPRLRHPDRAGHALPRTARRPRHHCGWSTPGTRSPRACSRPRARRPSAPAASRSRTHTATRMGSRSRGREVCDTVAAMTTAVDVPVTADIEAGQGAEPDAVAAAVGDVIDRGAVGINLEDSRPGEPGALFTIDAAARTHRERARPCRRGQAPVVHQRALRRVLRRRDRARGAARRRPGPRRELRRRRRRRRLPPGMHRRRPRCAPSSTRRMHRST